MEPDKKAEDTGQEASLEDNSSTVQEDSAKPQSPSSPAESEVSTTTEESTPVTELTTSSSNLHMAIFNRFNIYLILFILVLMVAAGVVVVSFLGSKNGPTTNFSSQKLSPSELQQLANSNVSVGNSGQVLTVQSNAVFSGGVLIRQNLDVAGNLQLGGTLALSGLSVNGASQFGQLTINKDLSVAGTTNLQGAVTIAGSLQVSGSANFGGSLSAAQLTTNSLQLNGDLSLAHHIVTNGATPARVNGSALGSGGTASISGDDTAGTVSINTGGGPAAGCFATFNFTSAFASVPHVLLTPVGASSAGLSYYINRTASSFSVCSASTPAADSSYTFDYFVVD